VANGLDWEEIYLQIQLRELSGGDTPKLLLKCIKELQMKQEVILRLRTMMGKFNAEAERCLEECQ
jgi:hypothetical protein